MVVLRVVEGVDVAELTELWMAAVVARRSVLATAGVPDYEQERRDAYTEIASRLGDATGFGTLAVEGDEIIAMALAIPARANDGASPELIPGLVHVSMVAVRPDRWGRGLGGAVLEAVQAQARQRGFARAQLWTHETNERAQQLYRRLGWQRSGRAKLDDYGEPIWHYTRDLGRESS